MEPQKRIAKLIDKFTLLRIAALEARDFARDEELKEITDELTALSEEIEGLGETGKSSGTAPVSGSAPRKKPGPKPKKPTTSQLKEFPPNPFATKPTKPVGRPRKRTFPEGSEITTKYKGKIYTVKVTKEGFVWKGKTYSSFEKLARAISGQKLSQLRRGARWSLKK